jgi:insulysin
MSNFCHPGRLRHLLVLFAALLLVSCATPEQQLQSDSGPIKSPNDERQYRYITLENGLRALLISDPDTEKAAASLDVYVGSSSNPPDRGGLAHFLEHMLFLGTEKYPDPGEYATFVAEHGGSRNAYTGFEHTNYFFDIDKDSLAPALDRFAQFFISPRFDDAYVGREVNAVEAEYQLSIKTDGRRNLDVVRELANPANPLSILGVGTKDTLADRPGSSIRDELLAFYQRYYSANLMALAILGSESLDELEVLVRDGFSAVPNRKVEIAPITEPVYPAGSLPLLVQIRPLGTARQLQISFPMPNYNAEYYRKPLQYIGNLLGHEGEGSLLSVLKSEGLAEGLGAGAGIAYRGGSAFNLSVNLTERGLREYEQVLYKVFEYIRRLQLSGAQQYLYQEQSQISALQFRFRESGQPIGYVTGLANDMQMFTEQDVLRGNFLMDDYQPQLIETILNKYLNAENAAISLVGSQVPVDRSSRFYGTEFSARTLAAGEGAWRSIDDKRLDARMQLPAANDFLPENVELRPLAADNPQHPARVVTRPDLNVWFRQDDEFRVPKGGIFTSFRSELPGRSARDAVLMEMYAALLRDSVNEYSYPARLAGLNFSLYKHARGLSLKISGYDDKQLVLLDRLVGSLQRTEFDAQRFENIRVDQIRGLENVKTARPFTQVMSKTRQLLMPGEWGEQALIAELKSLTPAQVKAFAEAFWASVQADVLINGNYTQATVAGVSAALQPLLRDPAPAALPDLEVVKLPANREFVYPVDIDHDDSVLFWYLQAPGDSWQDRAMAALSAQVVKANFFEDLRTDQQLGYVVSAFYWPLLEVPAVGFLVQSPTASAVDVSQAVQQFLSDSMKDGAVTEEQFLRHQVALVRELLQPHKNLWEESDYLWKQIAKRELAFDSRDIFARTISDISFEQWRAWFAKVLIEQRSAVAVTAPGRWQQSPAGEVVESRDTFQADNGRYQVQ